MANKILTVLCALFGIGMIVFGANKLFPFLPMDTKDFPPAALEAFGAFGKIKWLMPLVGIAEIVGGLLIAFPKTRALGAIVSLPVTMGILLHNIVYLPSMLVGPPLIFALINAWAIFASIKQYLPMINGANSSR
jgi:putative oxidoreductase